MDNYIARSRIEQALKSLELTSVVSTASDNWRSVWESVQHLYQKIRIFYQQFYRMMSLNDGKQVYEREYHFGGWVIWKLFAFYFEQKNFSHLSTSDVLLIATAYFESNVSFWQARSLEDLR